MPSCLSSLKQLPGLHLSILLFTAAQEDKPVQGTAGTMGKLAQVLLQGHSATHASLHTEQASPFPSCVKCPGCQEEERLKDAAAPDLMWWRRWETYKNAHEHWLPSTVMSAATCCQQEWRCTVCHSHMASKEAKGTA